MIVLKHFLGQCRTLPDKNQELKLIQKVDRFRRGPRRALGMDSVTIIGGQPIIFRAGFIFEGGHIFFFSGGEGIF